MTIGILSIQFLGSSFVHIFGLLCCWRTYFILPKSSSFCLMYNQVKWPTLYKVIGQKRNWQSRCPISHISWTNYFSWKKKTLFCISFKNWYNNCTIIFSEKFVQEIWEMWHLDCQFIFIWWDIKKSGTKSLMVWIQYSLFTCLTIQKIYKQPLMEKWMQYTYLTFPCNHFKRILSFNIQFRLYNPYKILVWVW